MRCAWGEGVCMCVRYQREQTWMCWRCFPERSVTINKVCEDCPLR